MRADLNWAPGERAVGARCPGAIPQRPGRSVERRPSPVPQARPPARPLHGRPGWFSARGEGAVQRGARNRAWRLPSGRALLPAWKA
ncbi:MAG: hypothetical protein DCC64_05755 [Planctomycetota bacterium]|nr:MAG: hypothetical protein DCC64_05755 [Planctomycetota bacterium]